MRGPEDGARPRAMQKVCKITPFMCPETYCADAGPIRHRNVQTGSAKHPHPRRCIVIERARTCGAMQGALSLEEIPP